MIKRLQYDSLKKDFFKGKIIHIPGARQVGKTTLLKEIEKKYLGNSIWLNGDESDIRILFENLTSTKLSIILGNAKLVIIDEAQRIKNIGLALKLIVDNFPDIQVIASGSSALELANQILEPLTGRKIEHFLYPISFLEMLDNHGYLNENRLLEHRMIYGYYPEVVMNKGNEIEILRGLSESYLYKDVFVMEGIKKPELIDKLVRALAYQIGNEVNSSELGQLVGADHKTVERYIDLLEKAYIVFKLSSLSRNGRNEIKKGKKIYFYDNGLRNAIIRNFNPIEMRNDIGALWENFAINERKKAINFHQLWMNQYFWRTHNQQEIDYIEDFGGILKAYEFKWKIKKRRLPNAFNENYSNNLFALVTPDNFLEFLNSTE